MIHTSDATCSVYNLFLFPTIPSIFRKTAISDHNERYQYFHSDSPNGSDTLRNALKSVFDYVSNPIDKEPSISLSISLCASSVTVNFVPADAFSDISMNSVGPPILACKFNKSSVSFP